MWKHSVIRTIKTHHNMDELQGSHPEGRTPCTRVDTGWFHLYVSSRCIQSTVIMKELFVMGRFTALMWSWFPGKIHTFDPYTMRRAIWGCSSPYIRWCRKRIQSALSLWRFLTTDGKYHFWFLVGWIFRCKTQNKKGWLYIYWK